MTKRLWIWLGVLGLQLAIAAYFKFRQAPMGVFVQNVPLLASKVFEGVSEVEFDDGHKKLVLKKEGDMWQIPEVWGFGVQATKIKSFLDTWAAMKKSYPAGKTMVAAKQFRTVEGDLERKITFKAGNQELASVYLGSSPSFRKIYARIGDQPETYVLDYNAFDVPMDTKDWLNQEHYAYERHQMKAIEIGSLKLKQEGSSFLVDPEPAGEETDVTKTADLVGKLSSPQLESVLGKNMPAPKEPPVLAYTITDSAGKERRFEYFEDDAEHYRLVIPSDPYTFKVKKSQLEGTMGLSAQAFLRPKSVAQAEETKP